VKPIILAGIASVVLALACYTIAFVSEQRRRRVDGMVLGFLALGVLFDLGSALFMILGAKGRVLTPHGVVGFTALGLMLVVTAWALRLRGSAEVTASFDAFFRIAFGAWVVAFVSGVVMVGAQRAAAPPAARLPF